MSVLQRVWATLLVCLATQRAVLGQEARMPLFEPQVYFTQGVNSTDSIIVAPRTVLAGSSLGSAAADSPEECAELCRTTGTCSWFNYCPAQGGCPVAALGYQECELLAMNGSLVPQVTAAGSRVLSSAGFPWSIPPRQFPGFATAIARGMVGSDFPCPGSVLPPNTCAYRTEAEAAMVCMRSSSCRTIVVYSQGLDGASDAVAILKSANLPPSSTIVSPYIYSITRLDNRSITATFLYNDNGTAILPAAAAAPGNSSWQGCFIGRNAVVDGIEVATLEQPSALACCRTCRSWGANKAFVPLNSTNTPSSCNCFNWCGEAGGCRLETADGVVLELAQNQCQLRFQMAIDPLVGYPATLIASGPNVPFQTGGPIVASGPQIPGYTQLPGRGLFSAGRFECPQSVRPEIQECVRPGSLQQLAGYCNSDPRCQAFIFKQEGIYGGDGSMAVFKRNYTLQNTLWNPSSVLYLRNEDYQTPSSGLSAGAIAGIAVGCAAAVAALAGIVAWVVHKRRRKLHQQGNKQDGSTGGMPPTPAVGTAGAGAAAGAGASVVMPAPLGIRTSPSGSAVTATNSGAGSGSAAYHSFSPKHKSFSLQQSSATGETGSPRDPSVVLPELAQLVQAHDAATASTEQDSSGGSIAPHQQRQQLLSATHLPPGLADFVVEPSSFTYCRLPSGKLHEIGSGASGKVYKAKFNNEFVAAKEIEIGTSPELQKTFVQEAVRLHQLRHATVVGFVGVAVTGTKGVLLLELCEGRDLFHALSLVAAGSRQRLFGWHRLGKRVALDLARALNYLHSKGVVHLDVKSSNVMLTASGAAKLGDVGVSVLQTRTFLSGLTPMVGTYAWAAPEVLMGQQCTAAVDIFSFGVVLWEIVTGEQPTRGRLRPPQVPQECPQEVADLITRCTSADPEQRPTAQQVLEQVGQLQRRGTRGGGLASLVDSAASGLQHGG